MLPLLVLSMRTRLGGRDAAPAGTRDVSPCTAAEIWYRRRQPTWSVTAFPPTPKGTAALANSRSASVLDEAMVVNAAEPSRVLYPSRDWPRWLVL